MHARVHEVFHSVRQGAECHFAWRFRLNRSASRRAWENYLPRPDRAPPGSTARGGNAPARSPPLGVQVGADVLPSRAMINLLRCFGYSLCLTLVAGCGRGAGLTGTRAPGGSGAVSNDAVMATATPRAPHPPPSGFPTHGPLPLRG